MAQFSKNGTVISGNTTMEKLLNTMQNRDAISYAQEHNELQKWFGAPAQDIQLGAYDKLAVTSHTLPDAYKGRNLYLRDTIDGLTMTGGEWYTTTALTWAATQEQHFRWSEWTFNMTLVGEVPHEGVPRLITSSSRQYSEHTTRRGLAFILEHGFWKTAQGQEMYRRNILGVKLAINETLAWDVSFTIANARSYQKRWQREKGVLNASAGKIMQLETQNFGIVNRSARAFDFAIGRAIESMRRYGVTPNMIIAPTDFRMYYKLLDPQKTTYYMYGPTGILELRAGPDAPHRVGDQLLFETRHMDIHDTQPPVDPFIAPTTVGEYYVMGNSYSDGCSVPYCTKFNDIYVWSSEGGGAYKKIRFEEAFAYVNRFDQRDQERRLRTEHETLAKMSEEDYRKRASNYDYPGSNPLLAGRAVNINAMLASHFNADFRDMFLFKRIDGSYGTVDYFGNMDVVALPNHMIHDIAKQYVDSKFGMEDNQDRKEASANIKKIEDIVSTSESHGYDDEWYLALIDANITRSLSGNNFIGKLTEPDIATYRKAPRIQELVPNEHGGLDLPPRTSVNGPDFQRYTVPPHINSWPMLLTLEAERGKGRGWDLVASSLTAPLSTVRRIHDLARSGFGSSAFISPMNRPAWFPKSDGATTLVHEVIVGPRDGVFLRIPAGISPIAPAAAGGPGVRDVNWNVPSSSNLVRTVIGADQSTNALYTALRGMATQPEIFDAILLVAAPDTISRANGAKITQESMRRIIHGIGLEVAKAKGSQETALNSIVNTLRNVLPSTLLEGGKEPSEMMIQTAMTKYQNLIKSATSEAVINAATNRIVTGDSRTKWSSDEEFPQIVANAGALADANQPTFAQLIVLKSQIDSLLTRLEGNVVVSGTNNAPPRGTTYAELIRNFVTNTESPTMQAELDMLRDLVNRYTQNAPDVAPLADGSRMQPPKQNILISNDAYDNGVWVRAPLNATRRLLESVVNVNRPYALPSNPDLAHLAPISKSTTNIQNLLQRDRYRIQSHVGAQWKVSSLSWTEAMQTFDIPSNVMDSAGLTQIPRELPVSASVGSHPAPRQTAAQSTGSKYGSLLSFSKKARAPTRPVEAISPSLYEMRERERDRDRDNTKYYQHSGRYEMDTIGTSSTGAGAIANAARYTKFDRKSFSQLHTDINEGFFASRFNYAQTITDPLLRIFFMIFIATRNTETQWYDFFANGVPPPARILLTRPNITHRMANMPLMIGGYSTGATFYGNSDVLLGDDAVTKVHIANITFNAKPVIVDSKNVFIQENAMYREYLYGRGVEFVRDRQDVRWGSRWNGSFISMLVPLSEVSFPDPIDLTGGYVIPDANPQYFTEEERNTHYTSARYYNEIYGFDKVVNSALVPGRTEPRWGPQGRRTPNTMCFHGFYVTYDPMTGRFSNVHLNSNGHLGLDGFGPRAQKVMNGADLMFAENPEIPALP